MLTTSLSWQIVCRVCGTCKPTYSTVHTVLNARTYITLLCNTLHSSMPFHIFPRYTLLFLTMPYHTLHRLTNNTFVTLPHISIHYLALPYTALHNLALPYICMSTRFLYLHSLCFLHSRPYVCVRTHAHRHLLFSLYMHAYIHPY